MPSQVIRHCEPAADLSFLGFWAAIYLPLVWLTLGAAADGAATVRPRACSRQVRHHVRNASVVTVKKLRRPAMGAGNMWRCCFCGELSVMGRACVTRLSSLHEKQCEAPVAAWKAVQCHGGLVHCQAVWVDAVLSTGHVNVYIV